jgi:hypothetical protein
MQVLRQLPQVRDPNLLVGTAAALPVQAIA